MRCAVNCKSPSDGRSAGNLHATFCGSRERVTALATRCEGSDALAYSEQYDWWHPIHDKISTLSQR
jgi:hypothetical protein